MKTSQIKCHKNYLPGAWLALPALLTVMLLQLLLLPAFGQEAGLEDLRRTGEAFRSVAKKVSPAVVFVQVEKLGKEQPEAELSSPFGDQGPFGDEFFRHFFGVPMPRGPQRETPPRQRQHGQGSGFIVSPDGYIMTNNHVVGDADKVTVQLEDGREFPAKVIGTDPHSDVAVIKIEASGLPILPLGDSDALAVGDWVLAVGNPFGLSHTITAGIVSAKGRSSVGITDYENFIQTDAAINPGNSGGPLVDLEGKAVGMNTAIFSQSGGYMGIGFAIPVNMVKSIRDQLVNQGSVTRGYLGVAIQDLTPELAQSFGLEGQKGALVSQVTKGSPAEKAGLKQGDVIVEYAGQPVTKLGDFRNKVAMTAPGTREKLVILREGKRQNLEITIGKLAEKEQKSAVAAPSANERLGLSVEALTPELAQQLGFSGETGVIVTQVTPGSVAAEAGLRRGMLIQELNHIAVKSPAEFKTALEKTSKHGTVLLLVREGEGSRYLTLKLE